MGLMKRWGELLRKGKSCPEPVESDFCERAQREPENANVHLKLAEVYQKKGAKQKAVGEYLLAADLFTKDQFYGRALAIYKQLCRRDPSLEQVYGKMADIYREKGCLADAIHQYRILAQHYEDSGEKGKALEIVKIMGEIDLKKIDGSGGGESRAIPRGKSEESSGPAEAVAEWGFDLGAALTTAEPLPVEIPQEVSVLEKGIGVEEIFKELKEIGGPSAADPHFNYNMGVAYRELGFFDEAMDQFEAAVKKGQKPFEALSMLGFGHWEKGMWDDARQSFEKALGAEKIPQEKVLSVKYILSLLYQESGQIENALRLLHEIATMDKGFLQVPKEIAELVNKAESRGIARLKTCARA
jgi:tetratricopeptide (TPR) repeat protein